MKHNIYFLKLKKEYENNPSLVKQDLIKFEGGNDVEHYKKYWLNTHFTKVYINHDAQGLVLRECSKEELEELKNKKSTVKVEKINEPLQDYYGIVSVVAKFMDFEEDKYDYYEVQEEDRNWFSFYTLRVLK